MNKEDLSKVRKNFKTDSERLNVRSIYNIICMSDTFKVLTEDDKYFGMLDEDLRDKFILSFKKILTGSFDSNLFNLKFKNDNGANYQGELLALRDNNLEEDDVVEFARKVVQNGAYGTEVLLTLLTATVIVPTKSQKKKSEEDDDLEGYEYEVVMCMVSKLAPKTASFVLDKDSGEIKITGNIGLLDIKNPIEGFTFPSYNGGFIDVNNVLYYTSKKDEPNEHFINNVLGCERNITAKVQKELFNTIIKTAVGERVDAKTLSQIYEDVKEQGEISGDGVVSTKNITKVLTNKGFGDEEKIKEAIATVLKKDEAELSVDNIVPTKQIELKNSSISVKIKPEKLNTVIQTNTNGKRVLMIELDDNINIDELTLGAMKK